MGYSLEVGLEACGCHGPLKPCKPHSGHLISPPQSLAWAVTHLSVQTGSLPEMSPVPSSSASQSHEVGQAQAVAATLVPPHRAQAQPLNPGQGLQACQPTVTSFLCKARP